MVKNLPAVQETLSLIPVLGRSPGEGTGNHSGILAWRIPWTEEPGELHSIRSQRVGHSCVTLSLYTYMLIHVLPLQVK